MRINMLDVVRGLAIIGTLGTNIWVFGGMGFSDEPSKLDDWISAVTNFLTNGKFLGLLTILFGVGMQLKYQSYMRRELPWKRMYLWSMLLLLLDGYIHFVLVFEFDVLMSYAVSGMIVALVITRSERFMAIVMAVAGIIHLISQVKYSLPFMGMERLSEEDMPLDERYFDEEFIAMGATWLEQVQYRFLNFWDLRGEAIMILPMNVFLFLLGVFLVRKGVFQSKKLQNRLLIFGLGVGIPLNLAPNFIDSLSGYDRYVFAPVLSLGYIGIIFMLDRYEIFPRLQKYMGNIGKMALSCYVLQNVVASIIFYEWGFNLAAHTNSVITLAMWGIITVFMAVFSTLWLKFFGQGPFESTWRKLSLAPFKGRL